MGPTVSPDTNSAASLSSTPRKSPPTSAPLPKYRYHWSDNGGDSLRSKERCVYETPPSDWDHTPMAEDYALRSVSSDCMGKRTCSGATTPAPTLRASPTPAAPQPLPMPEPAADQSPSGGHSPDRQPRPDMSSTPPGPELTAFKFHREAQKAAWNPPGSKS